MDCDLAKVGLDLRFFYIVFRYPMEGLFKRRQPMSES